MEGRVVNSHTARTIINEVEQNGSVIKNSQGAITHYAITADNWRRIRTTLEKEVDPDE